MPKPIKATELGLEPHYKVRVIIPGAILHLASRDEPQIVRHNFLPQPVDVKADWYDDEPDYGDTIGHIDWTAVKAITWRWSE